MEFFDKLTSFEALKIVKFSIVGLIGLLINIVVFYICTEIIQINYNFAAIAAFGIAVTNNYLMNHSWTFSEENEGIGYKLVYYVKYMTSNLIGLAINLIILNLIIVLFSSELRVISQLLGVVAGASFDYLCAKKIVFLHVDSKL